MLGIRLLNVDDDSPGNVPHHTPLTSQTAGLVAGQPEAAKPVLSGRNITVAVVAEQPLNSIT